MATSNAPTTIQEGPDPARVQFRIGFAVSPEDVNAVAGLFHEYTTGLGIDLTYQSFEEELATLPGKYASPHGALLVARAEGGSIHDHPIGCVALRPLAKSGEVESNEESPYGQRCELKRLYVRSEARGSGLGETMLRQAIKEAIARGYTEMVMDTLSSMEAAQRLYKKLGFVEIPAYYDTPIGETTFLRLGLRNPKS